jgi:hypothetical protein
MSTYTISRIRNVLEKQFATLIDMSDWAGRPAGETQSAFLSRALAALCIRRLAKVDAATAAAAVTDGYNDNGLDAVHFDQTSDTLHLVQTKWSQEGNKTIGADSTGAFAAGVRDLLSLRLERFNDKIKAKEADVKAALYADRAIQIVLTTAHTGAQQIASHAKSKVDDLIDDLNQAVPVARAEHYDQAGVYGLITAESQPGKIKLQIGLNDWGVIEKPFLAYYGRVHISEIAQWWRDHGNALFSQNLRLFYVNSDVNDALRNTLATDPESFWYFNNGITLICDTVGKALAGATARTLGLFHCEGASIVNGAQTVGTIGGSYLPIEGGEAAKVDAPQSWVQVRIISLEKCPPEFSRAITRATNLQNAVGNREFAAMDPRQHRIAADFALDKRKYVYKSGEPDPKGDEGCSIVEATQALGCAISAGLAVQVKREIGALWANTAAAPYSEIFSDGLSTTWLWRSVLVMRSVDEEIHKLRSSPNVPRADVVGVHLNRIILHLVFQDPEVKKLSHDGSLEGELIAAARKAAHRLFPLVAEYLQEKHDGEYLASLCKNSSKCEPLVKSILAAPKAAPLVQQEMDLS